MRARPGTFDAFVLLVLLLTSASLAGAEADEWTLSRTAWGAPDLQGVYTTTTLTSFERPEALKDKAFLTEEEVAEMESGRARMIAGADERSASKTEAGGNVGAYNLHWMELGTKVVGSRRTSLVIDPSDGRVPVRPAADAKRRNDIAHVADSYEYQSVWDRCITRGVPGVMFPAGYNNGHQILQTEDLVVIVSEMIHSARVIPIDGRPRLDSAIAQWNGDSRGHWDGDTLVVTSSNFNDKSWIATSGSQGRIKGIQQTPNTKVVERFTRVSDDIIDWQVTIEDDGIYTAPWTVAIPMRATDPPYEMFEYACHEGNWSVSNTLSGGRALDGAGSSGGR